MAVPAEAATTDEAGNITGWDEELLNKRSITAGWYATEDGATTSVAHWLEEEDFRKNGGVMKPFKATKTFIFSNKEGNIDYKMKYLNVN